MNNLFNKQLFNKHLKKIQITQEQKDNITLWNQMLENGELIAETSNYHYFEKVFLNTLLGYDSFTDILADDKEVHGSGKSEFKLKIDDKVFMIIELKGSNVNLDKDRNNKNETPVDQVFRYAKKNEAVPWLLVSNYDEFRLYNYHKGDGKYISWNMNELSTNEDKLKEFIFILGKKSYENNIIDNLVDKTITIQEDFNDEFYKLYSETRLMLIHDLEEQSEDTDRLKAIHYAQLIMDRIIFICFAEDKGLLPEQILEETTLTPIDNNNVRKHRIFDRIRELFEDVHEGNPGKNVPEYNGGLFKERLWFLDLQDTVENGTEYYKNCFSGWKFESQKNEIEKRLGDYNDTLNPIYKNFLTMAVFNFDSDVDVNILGHIFESSISDIEKLKEDNSETRHKFGIHYTPQKITEYICRNTIIPYLSKSEDINEIPELLSEYTTDLEVLDEKLKNIKILDPACGSGAFLNKAVDILLEIHEAVWHKKYDNKQTLDKFFDSESERREIILNNIYGVDLNEESTEITKLGLFLKICKKDKKLPSLDENIKCGNSVIDDPRYAGEKAFKWEEEYKEILDNGGFDIIIGNPPYVRVQEIDYNQLDYYSSHYDFAMGHIDLSILFIELANRIVKKIGKIGFITSNMFLTADYGQNIRTFLSKGNLRIDKILDFGDLPVFDDALTYVNIFLFTKSICDDFEYYYIKSLEENLNEVYFNQIKIKDLNETPWILKGYLLKDIFIKMNKHPKLSDGIGSCHYGMKTGMDKVMLIEEAEINNFETELILKWCTANDCKRYSSSSSKKYVIYPYMELNGETVLIKENELKNNYPKTYNYLSNNKQDLLNRKDSRKTVDEHEWYKLIRYGNINLFKKRKILFPAICKSNKFCISEKYEGFSGGSVFAITSETTSLEYLLGIFNSKLMQTYLHSITSLKKGGYHSYSSKSINNCPIVLNNDVLENEVEKIVDVTGNMDNEIKGFLKWLQGEYNIDKLSQKLEKYYELTFDEFLEELRKKKVDTKKRSVRENLEAEFYTSLDIIRPLQQQIQELEDEINQKVYKLYDLTDDEIKIIEDSLND